MQRMILTIAVIALPFFAICYYQIDYKDILTTFRRESMETDEQINDLKKMEALMEFVKTLEIDKRAKEEILKKIDFEVHIIRRSVFYELGQQEYNKLVK